MYIRILLKKNKYIDDIVNYISFIIDIIMNSHIFIQNSHRVCSVKLRTILPVIIIHVSCVMTKILLIQTGANFLILIPIKLILLPYNLGPQIYLKHLFQNSKLLKPSIYLQNHHL